MKIATVGIDLAKNIFSMHGIDEHGKAALRRTVSRGKLMETMAGIGLSLAFRGSPCSRGDRRLLPGANAVAGLDDYWQNNIKNYYLLPVTIPAATIVTVQALLDRVPVYLNGIRGR